MTNINNTDYNNLLNSFYDNDHGDTVMHTIETAIEELDLDDYNYDDVIESNQQLKDAIYNKLMQIETTFVKG